MRWGRFAVTTACLLASGCAVAPGGPGDGSVTHDVVDYLHREWPLNAPAGESRVACSCHGEALCDDAKACGIEGACPADGPRLYADDWDQPGILPHAKAYTSDPPPAVPLGPGGPGRFFPAPTRPVFSPRGPG